MAALPATTLSWLASGGLLILLGALIKFRGWTFLIAGYDDTSPVPEDVAADMVGNAVLRIGTAAASVGVLAAVTTVPSSLPLVFAAVVAVDVARLLYRLNTYPPADSTG